MDIPWGSDISKRFVTAIGLITSDGPFGPNIATCEWTHHVSYRPGLIAVCFRPADATHENISKTKEFGVNIASTEQNTLSSLVGNTTGREFDKIGALKELGFQFYKAKKIKPPMVKDAVINLECKLVKAIPLGDHTMFVGEAVTSSFNPEKQPLIYNQLMYGRVKQDIPKPSAEERAGFLKVFEKYRKPISS